MSAGGRPGTGRLWAIRRLIRYVLSRVFAWVAVRSLLRVRVEGRERYPTGPALICFNHQSWTDPFVLMATLPWRPRLYFFGPREEDMSVGGRNRLMTWTGSAVPFKPAKTDLLDTTRRVGAIFDAGAVLAIAGEGRIHAGEGELLPLDEGAAFFALRSGVPVVPVAINGTSWLAFGRRIRIRIGSPIPASGRPTHEAVAELTDRTWAALHELVGAYPDPVPPRVGSRWYRFTERFNEWPEGVRPSVADRSAGSPEPGASPQAPG
jgi:1-acyl-sn-glycerol-3-phosphate acyltransferase